MAGTKSSKQYEAILEYVKGTTSHPTADSVYIEMRKIMPHISLGTVYRNLSKLAGEEKILRLTAGLESEHFDGNTNLHYHVVCTKCGVIADIEAEEPGVLNDWAQQRYNGEIDKHSVMFYGVCAECEKIN